MLFPHLFITTTPTFNITDAVAIGKNALQDCIHLQFLKRSPTITIEPVVTEELSDGTSHVASEKASLVCGTFLVDIITLTFLQSFKGQMVYGYLFDPNRMNFVVSFFNLRLSLSIIAQNNESAIINLSASREETGLNAYGNLIALDNAASDLALITGTVYDVGGATPLTPVEVRINLNSYCYTDSYGRYYILAPIGSSLTFTLTKAGKTFPSGQTINPPANTESIRNFTALT